MACGPGRFYHARYSGAAGVGRRRPCGGGGRRTATDGVQVWRGRVPRRHVAHGEEPQPLFLQVPGGESVALLPLVRGGNATGICSSSLFKFALFQNRRTTHLLPYPITLLQLLGSSTPSLQRSISLAESSGVCVSNRELSPSHARVQECGFFQWCDAAPMPAAAATDNGQDAPALDCSCGRGPCSVLTANTAANPGRKFYKCPGVRAAFPSSLIIPRGERVHQHTTARYGERRNLSSGRFWSSS
jgi:hypothetical protein